MNSLLRAALWGGTGTAGLAGVGSSGWSIYDSSFPTINSRLSKQGYSFEPVRGPNEPHNPKSGNRFKWQAWDCSKRLFPGVEIKATSTEDAAAEVDSMTLTEGSQSNAGKPVGCALVEMHPWTDSENISRSYLRAEVALKNDKVGFIVWSGWAFGSYPGTVSGDTTHSKTLSFDCVYRAILLEKEGEKWTVKGGYEWEDSGATSTFTATVYSAIVGVPSEKWLDNIKFSNVKDAGRKSWLGVWEPVEDGGAHPLQDIVLGWHSPTDNLTVMEVLGADKSNLFSPDYHCDKSPTFCGYESITRRYDATVGWKKVSQSRAKSAQSVLNSWYSPFLNETGKWTEMGKRCRALDRDRNAKTTSLGPLRDLCYQNSSSVPKT